MCDVGYVNARAHHLCGLRGHGYRNDDDSRKCVFQWQLYDERLLREADAASQIEYLFYQLSWNVCDVRLHDRKGQQSFRVSWSRTWKRSLLDASCAPAAVQIKSIILRVVVVGRAKI